ncbi:MAG: hypothetical protein WDM96_03535 [Lacunisphaera sp.]
MTVRRAAGEEGRGEEHAEQAAALAGGQQGAETVERMGDLLTAKAEEKRADRRMGQVVEGGERTFAQRAKDELAERGRGQGEQNGVELGALHGLPLRSR